MGDIQPGNRAVIGKSVTTPEDDSIVQSSGFIFIKDPMGRARVEMAPDIDFVVLTMGLGLRQLAQDGQLPVDEPAKQLVVAVKKRK